MFEQAFEVTVGYFCEIGGKKCVRGLQFGRVVGLRSAIPRTGIEADIASKQSVATLCGLLVGQFGAIFDGEIGDAAARVECAVGGECVRGTSVDTFGAAAAVVGLRRVVVERQRADNFANHRVRTERGIDEQPIFANPAEPSTLCPAAFEQGRAVAADLATLLGATVDKLLQLPQFLLYDVVIVVAVGVFGNLWRTVWQKPRRVVVEQHHDDRPRAFDQ